MKIFQFAAIVPAVLLLASCATSANTPGTGQNPPAGNQSRATTTCIPADKIIVANFHGTRRCAACIAVGEMAQKTIEQKFPKEYRAGIIEFHSIDGERRENWNEVQKYQARGSSLFINTVHGGQETIQEEVNVWRLIGNEANYIQYFEDRLRNLLECS